MSSVTSAVVPYRRDNSDLGFLWVCWPVDCPGMSGVVSYRRDNLDLGLWGVSWPVDCPRMSVVVQYRRDNLDLRGNHTLGLVSRMTLGYPCFLGYPKDNFGTSWQSWTTLTLPWLYFTLLDSTYIYHGSTSLYLILHNSTVALLQSTRVHIILSWLYFTLLDST